MTICRPGPDRARAGGGRGGRRARPAGTPRHDRHGRAAGVRVGTHSSPAARSSASVVLPTPSGPTSRSGVRRPAADHPRRSRRARRPGRGSGRRPSGEPASGGSRAVCAGSRGFFAGASAVCRVAPGRRRSPPQLAVAAASASSSAGFGAAVGGRPWPPWRPSDAAGLRVACRLRRRSPSASVAAALVDVLDAAGLRVAFGLRRRATSGSMPRP